MLIGYARVSTSEQDARLQTDALEQAGCERIFVDHGVSGAAVIKPQLAAALDFARAELDAIVVWKLDRLSRSLRDLLDTVEGLQARGVGIRSLTETTIDTTTPHGKLVFRILSSLADYERGLIHERTMAGIAAAQRAGTKFGRPETISDKRWAEARELLDAEPPKTIAAVASLLNVSRQAIYRRLERDDAKRQAGPAGADQTPSPRRGKQRTGGA